MNRPFDATLSQDVLSALLFYQNALGEDGWAEDPLNPMIDKFEEEYNLNLGLLNGGQAKLSHQNTADSSLLIHNPKTSFLPYVLSPIAM